MDETKKLIPILNQNHENILQCEKGTSLVKNSSQTLEIKDKTNEKSHI